MSYVSKNTFRENKAEPMPDARPIVNNINYTIDINHSRILMLATNLVHQLSQQGNSMQIRGFRTHRNIESQMKRNPTFASRIQQFFGLFTTFWNFLLLENRFSFINCVISIFSPNFKSRFSFNINTWSFKTTP